LSWTLNVEYHKIDRNPQGLGFFLGPGFCRFEKKMGKPDSKRGQYDSGPEQITRATDPRNVTIYKTSLANSFLPPILSRGLRSANRRRELPIRKNSFLHVIFLSSIYFSSAVYIFHQRGRFISLTRCFGRRFDTPPCPLRLRRPKQTRSATMPRNRHFLSLCR